ncbi:MAG: O-antigen ligase family protein [Bacteroidota bacterium]
MPHLYFIGFALIVIGLSLGVFLISLGTFIALGAWIIDALLTDFSFAFKFKKFFAKKGLVFIVCIFLIHVLGLIFTQDFDYALKDLRIKLPLLALPIIMAGAPNLKQSGREWLIKVFILSLFVSSLISFYVIFTERPADLRVAMLFSSHIRIGLMIALALFLIFHLWKNQGKIWKVLFVLIGSWLIYFLYKAQLTTGLMVFFIAALTLAVKWSISNWERGMSRILILGNLGIAVFVFVYFSALRNSYFEAKDDLKSLEQLSPKGEKYIHNTESTYRENGYRVDIYWAPKEIESGWNKIANKGLNEKDDLGQMIKSTLKRYMTSKGLRKDASGLDSLTNVDIKNILSGKTNYLQDEWNPIQKRFNELAFEWTNYENRGNPSGNSLFMRTEFWKAGWSVFKSNFFFGTGSGDVRNEVLSEYERNGTLLTENYRYRIHNQYLTFAATFGVFGLLLLMAFLFYPVLFEKKTYIYFAFVLIWALSFLTEDTLETQVGATFYAFFSSFFLSARD